MWEVRAGSCEEPWGFFPASLTLLPSPVLATAGTTLLVSSLFSSTILLVLALLACILLVLALLACTVLLQACGLQAVSLNPRPVLSVCLSVPELTHCPSITGLKHKTKRSINDILADRHLRRDSVHVQVRAGQRLGGGKIQGVGDTAQPRFVL